MAVPSNLNTLNYPIETALAKKFWASRHKSNKAKAIMAFSTSIENANWNLIQYGYTNSWRDRIIANYSAYINNPSMAGIPFTELSTPWWIDMPYVPGNHLPLTPTP